MVIVDFEKYHNQLNELEVLKQLLISIVVNGYTEDIKNEIHQLNKKYMWWV